MHPVHTNWSLGREVGPAGKILEKRLEMGNLTIRFKIPFFLAAIALPDPPFWMLFSVDQIFGGKRGAASQVL